MNTGHSRSLVRRLTVEAPMIVPLDAYPTEDCQHEITWFSPTDYVERCALCGEYLGLWAGRPKEPKGTVW